MTLSTRDLETLPDQTEKPDAWAASFTQGAVPLFAGALAPRSELRRTKSGGEPPDSTRSLGLRLAWFQGLRGELARALLTTVAAVALVSAPQAAFAQHGGGGHGGGGHFGGGGGGHFGGGGGHGGSHGSAPAAGVRSGGSPSGVAMRPGTPPVTFVHGGPTIISRSVSPFNFARPTGPERGFAGGFPGGVAARGPQHVTIGFPPVEGADGFTVSGSTVAGASPTAGSRPFAPIHGNGGALSFSGQGHAIWQDSPREGDMRQGGRSGSLLESRPLEWQQPHPFPPRRFHGGFGLGYGYGYGYGFGGFYPWGFGLGLDFSVDCDPLWDFGCDAYGYQGYGYDGPYAPEVYLDSSSGDESAATAPDIPQESGVYSEQNTAPRETGASTVLYLNDGTSFAVTDYWVAGYKLHYVTDGARENAIDLDQIDVQRTVDENAARGVNFTLRPAPTE